MIIKKIQHVQYILTFNRNVSLESRYGVCRFFPREMSTKDMITLPSVDNDLLILPASFKYNRA